MRKMWDNGAVRVMIEVRPLISTNEEEGFISPELYAMLDENEKRELEEAVYGMYGYEYKAASYAKMSKDQFKTNSTISWNNISSSYDRVKEAEKSIEETVKSLQEKYGIKTVVK